MDSSCLACLRSWALQAPAKQPSWTSCLAASETQVRLAKPPFMEALLGCKTTLMDILSGGKRDPGKDWQNHLHENLVQNRGKIGKTTFMDTSSLAANETQVSLAELRLWKSCLAISLPKQVSWTCCLASIKTQLKLGQTTFHAHPVWPQSGLV